MIKYISQIVRYLMKITLRSRLGKLPRMFASHYEALDPDSARIMARYGIRSPSGLRIAMRKHKVNNIDDLAKRLEHHYAQRQIQKRFDEGIARLGGGGTLESPHRKEIRQLVQQRGKPSEKEIIRARIRKVKETI